jgi:signal transduction histidine kinase
LRRPCWAACTGRAARAKARWPGLLAGFALWTYTLMLPSIAKSGLVADRLHCPRCPSGLALLRPEQLLGLADGLDNLTHSLFWSLLANVGLYVGVSLAAPPSAPKPARRCCSWMCSTAPAREHPVFWRGRARVADLLALARRFLGGNARNACSRPTRASAAWPRRRIEPDAQLVQFVETQLAGAIGSASARVMVASVVEEEALAMDDVLRILDEASQMRAYSHELEEATRRTARRQPEAQGLDRLKDDFMSSVTHELRTPLTSIRALAELMVDDADMPAAQRQQFLAIVVAETERLSRLVNQVLDMAKIESGPCRVAQHRRRPGGAGSPGGTDRARTAARARRQLVLHVPARCPSRCAPTPTG